MFTTVAVLVGPVMAVASALPTTSVPVDGQAAVDAAVAAFDDFASTAGFEASDAISAEEFDPEEPPTACLGVLPALLNPDLVGGSAGVEGLVASAVTPGYRRESDTLTDVTEGPSQNDEDRLLAVVWTVDEDQSDELASDVAWFGSKAAAACLDAALEQSVADDAPGDGTIPRPSAGAVTTASVQDLGVGDTSSAITVGIDISVAEPDVALEYTIAFSAVQVGTTGFLVFHGLYSEHDGELDVAVSTDALTTMVDAIG